ncbi:uncharacterized protein LOC107370542 [Tetranychus urticae]|uniref:uncharacterized protein LOC107370542 n=1 Tax=Tetranychus urticae TaxID=32264 RepID=UPI00077BFE74|nr:uncharacterized protein LOC107370542 [Tetranychus urticae]
MIIKELMKENLQVSALFSVYYQERDRKKIKRPPKIGERGRKRKLTKRQQNRLYRLLRQPNPPTITSLSTKFEVSPPTIIYYRDKIFNLKKFKKRRIHALNASAVLQRRRRSWPLYRLIMKKGWNKFITSDEKMFYLADGGSETDFYYADPTVKEPKKTKKKSGHKRSGIMVWAAVSAAGKSSLIFVDQKAKINAEYYIQHFDTIHQ